MKKVVKKYNSNKFCRFINGLLFGVISFGSLAYCTTNIIKNTNIQLNIVLPFLLAIISMLMGMFTMFRRPQVSKELV